MSAATDLLNALYAGTKSPILVFHNEVEEFIEDRKFFEGDFKEIYVNTVVQDGVAFLLGSEKNTDRETWKTCRLKPTAVLFKNGESLFLWVLEKPIAEVDAAPIAAALGMERVDEFIPLPPTNGWELIHCDKDQYYALKDLQSAYAPAGSTTGQKHDNATSTKQKYGDAICLTPFDPDDPRYQQEMIISVGTHREDTNWRPDKMKISQFITRLTKHNVGKKDGPAFVTGDIVPGRRLKTSVKALYAVGLDIDNGMSSQKIDEVLLELGCLAVRYTTHSHATTKTLFKKDTIIKFIGDNEITTESVQNFLRENEHWDETIVASAEFLEIEHTERGIMAVVGHAKMPKNRIVVPFLEPFDIGKEAPTQQEAMDKWTKIPLALAEKLGIPIDRSGTDPSRLFYAPRHDENRPCEITIIGGDLFDWRTRLDLDDPYEALAKEVTKGTSKSKTAEGRELARWSNRRAHGFQIMDCIEEYCQEKRRGGKDIECPFDENHNNAGAPDDKACFAVNAGESSTDFFVVSCRHDSCQGKTMLDMVGKMVKDGWFPREALDDERFNAAVDEEVARAKSGGKQSDDITELKAQIETLTSDSDPEAIEIVIAAIAELKSQVRSEQLMQLLKRRTDLGITGIRESVNAAKRKNCASSGPELVSNGDGRMGFRYHGDYDDDAAKQAVTKAVLSANGLMSPESKGRQRTSPEYTCVYEDVMRLRRTGGRIAFEQIRGDVFQAEISDKIYFQRRGDEDWGPRKQVPKDIADLFYNTAWQYLPQTPDLVKTPLFVGNFRLVQEAGWYRAGGSANVLDDINMLLADSGLRIPRVSPKPSQQDVRRAVDLLSNELLHDFPFCDRAADGTERSQPSRANAVAMLLTPFVRRCIEGCTPVFMIAKPDAGMGGTLLAKLSMLLFDGEESLPLHYSANDEEMEKGLVSAIRAGNTHLLFDNVKEFNNRSILKAVTARIIGGRQLGLSSLIQRENNFQWIATGVSPLVNSEMRRRICWIRINAKTADIQGRKYKREELEKWVLESRAELVWSILTLVQAWVANGSKRFTQRSLASFGEWAAVVGGVLENAGIKEFLDNPAPVGINMQDAAEQEFIVAWHKKFGSNWAAIADVVAWGLETEQDLVEGWDPNEKRRSLLAALRTLDGKTFRLEHGSFSLQQTINGEKGAGCELCAVPDDAK